MANIRLFSLVLVHKGKRIVLFQSQSAARIKEIKAVCEAMLGIVGTHELVESAKFEVL